LMIVTPTSPNEPDTEVERAGSIGQRCYHSALDGNLVAVDFVVLPYRYEYTLRTFRKWSKNEYQFGTTSVSTACVNVPVGCQPCCRINEISQLTWPTKQGVGCSNHPGRTIIRTHPISVMIATPLAGICRLPGGLQVESHARRKGE